MNRLRQLLRTCAAKVCPAHRLLVRGQRPIVSGRPCISLTFDDGPDATHTPDVLAALQKYQVPATFFVIGQAANRETELLREIIAGGHSLANHTWTHSEPAQTSAAQFLAEVAQTAAFLQQFPQTSHRWIRPPKGELTLAKLWGLWRTGNSIALWNVDPRDFRMNSQDDVQRWCLNYTPRHGDILLLHDNRPWSAAIIHALGERGVFEQVRCVSLEEWTQHCHRRLSQSTQFATTASVEP